MNGQGSASAELYYEDLVPGRRFASRWIELTAEDIIDFARKYDPQPFHLDREAGRRSPLGDLAASGWHTAATTMRLIVDGELKLAGGALGMGAEKIRWRRPVLVGDRLTATVDVAERRESGSDRGKGIVKLDVTTRNQREEVVQEMTTIVLVRKREGG